MKKKHTKLKIVLIILLVGIVAFLAYAMLSGKISLFNKDNKGNEQKEEEKTVKEEEPPVPPTPKLKIINLESKTRPIGIMVDNEKGAWPQAGLQEAFLIYEIIVEGGETRFFALYKDSTASMIGPDRSARHYFLDYAMENDAIFIHFGFSPQAQSDINKFGINNISGTQADGGAFWREKVITTSWQNCFTSISNLTSKATAKGYRMTSEATPLLNYSVAEIEPMLNVDAKLANVVRINYSKSHYVTYEYDAINKIYKRNMRGLPHADRVTGAQLTAKNIIIYNVRNYPLNDEPGKGRQGIDNIGSGDGYYITDGYSIPIKWEKVSRSAKTVYRDLAGNEIKVNDGNTFIHLQPLYQTLTIE